MKIKIYIATIKLPVVSVVNDKLSLNVTYNKHNK